VEGTTNVLQACADAGGVKRVVVTSSCAAISSGSAGNPGDPSNYVYTEKDWSDEAVCTSYIKSKLKAEQAAWDLVK
jgi:nucleoside-diphosphate-sugar epimerase